MDDPRPARLTAQPYQRLAIPIQLELFNFQRIVHARRPLASGLQRATSENRERGDVHVQCCYCIIVAVVALFEGAGKSKRNAT